MTKKDYEMLARLINHRVQRDLPLRGFAFETLKGFAWDFSDEAKRDNPRFDRDRFLKACGVCD